MVDALDLYRMQLDPMVAGFNPSFDSGNQSGAMDDPYAQPLEFPQTQPVVLQPQATSPVMQMAAAQSAPDYTPTTGSEMEADSRSSIDKILARMQAAQEANHQNDRNMQWMSFFSKLAASKSPSLLQGLGEGSEALAETTGKQQATDRLLQQSNMENELKAEQWRQELALKKETVEQGKYVPIKDAFGNVTAVLNTKQTDANGKPQIISLAGGAAGAGSPSTTNISSEPSSDPQEAAHQILAEQGSDYTPVATRQDIAGRNAQAKAYRDAANAAKATKQNLDMLNAQTGKYIPGKLASYGYGAESAMDMGGQGASARAEADKASKALANSFMQANVGAKGAGIRMVEFDSGAVPNADMTDEARSALIQKNKAIADSQIQRATISDLYPRMHLSNVNAIMDNYEAQNPPILPDGSVNSKWMTYKDWLKAGRPNTAVDSLGNSGGGQQGASQPQQSPVLSALLAEKARRKAAQ